MPEAKFNDNIKEISGAIGTVNLYKFGHGARGRGQGAESNGQRTWDRGPRAEIKEQRT